MIEHSSKKGDLVLDPFAGSGAICKASEIMGRKWIGVEIEEKWIKGKYYLERSSIKVKEERAIIRKKHEIH